MHNTGVIHQNIDMSEGINSGVAHRFDTAFLADINVYRKALISGSVYFSCNRLGRLEFDICDNDACTRLRQTDTNGLADAVTATRDNGNLVRDVHISPLRV